MTSGHFRIDKRFHKRTHFISLVIVWLLVVATTSVYCLFVKADVWRPAFMWWLLTSGAIVLSAAYAAFLVVRQMFRKSHRTWSIAIFMGSLTPLIWCGAYAWSTIAVANNRGDLNLTLPTRALGLWVCGYFEMEARWRYPRITEGQHVQLFDDGKTPNVDLLVGRMDQHIEAMATLLGHPVPKTKTVWVRGSLLGQDARSVGAWAICNPRNETTGLQYVDKHEVAHSLITLMCPATVDMPMLLAEGWAQSQSAPAARSILDLIKIKRSGNSLSLMELTSDEFYGRSIAPAYSHGAPLAMYLLERLGGPEFLRLYRDVRRTTFEEDVRRILGVDWEKIDSDFSVWLMDQQQKALREAASLKMFPATITIENPEDDRLWKQILIQLAAAEQTRIAPDSAAFQLTVEGQKLSHTVQVVIEQDSAWTFLRFPDRNPDNEYGLLTQAMTAFVRETSEGRFIGETDRNQSSIAVRQEIESLRRFWFRRHWLTEAFYVDILNPSLDDENISTVIHKIQPGDTPEAPWVISFSTSFRDQPDRMERAKVWVDPCHDFDLIKTMTTASDGSNQVIEYESTELFDGQLVDRWMILDGSKTTRSSIRLLNKRGSIRGKRIGSVGGDRVKFDRPNDFTIHLESRNC